MAVSFSGYCGACKRPSCKTISGRVLRFLKTVCAFEISCGLVPNIYLQVRVLSVYYDFVNIEARKNSVRHLNVSVVDALAEGPCCLDDSSVKKHTPSNSGVKSLTMNDIM